MIAACGAVWKMLKKYLTNATKGGKGDVLGTNHGLRKSNITRYVYILASTKKKRFHKTVEALAQLFLFTATLIKLMKFLIFANKKQSHARLTPVTNTYPVYLCFSLSGFICEQKCLFIDRSTVPSTCHLPLSNNSTNQKRNENRIQIKQISIHLRVWTIFCNSIIANYKYSN